MDTLDSVRSQSGDRPARSVAEYEVVDAGDDGSGWALRRSLTDRLVGTMESAEQVGDHSLLG